jgi:hypothetical protein
MAINQISTANTFQQWLVATQSLIGVANNLTDGTGGTFYANTDMVVDGDLTVTGNITLDAVGYNDLNVAGNLVVGGDASISTLSGDANTAIYANIANATTTSTADALAFAIALG